MLLGGGRSPPEHPGAPPNREFSGVDAAIAPGRSFIIMPITGRRDDRGEGGLYIAGRKNRESSNPRHFLSRINSPWLQFRPSLSRSARHLHLPSVRPSGIEAAKKPLKRRGDQTFSQSRSHS
jgi:hypothetical protein